jgi:hypothetical protein
MKSRLAIGAAMAALCIAGNASALTVPFTEDFAADAAGWENAVNEPLTWNETGGPDGSSHVSTTHNYFGFSNPFGGGPVLFRASQSDGASGGAFVGDWIAGGVGAVSAWVYQETGVDLVFYLRVATAMNFPGAVINDDVAVPSGEWTLVTIEIDTETPPCFEETVPCAEAFAAVGNFQLGTDAPEALTVIDEPLVLAIDQVALVPAPEPAAAAGGAACLAALAGLGRLRRSGRGG